MKTLKFSLVLILFLCVDSIAQFAVVSTKIAPHGGSYPDTFTWCPCYANQNLFSSIAIPHEGMIMNIKS